MGYETLLDEAAKEGIEVFENNCIGQLDGLYVDNTITINSSNITTDRGKKCILAEELGHHYTSCGNILDQSTIENRKQERRARGWAYDKTIGIIGLLNAFERGARNSYEIAEYLDVTEQFLHDAIKYYKEKYGLYYIIDNYMLCFEPLIICKMI